MYWTISVNAEAISFQKRDLVWAEREGDQLGKVSSTKETNKWCTMVNQLSDYSWKRFVVVVYKCWNSATVKSSLEKGMAGAQDGKWPSKGWKQDLWLLVETAHEATHFVSLTNICIMNGNKAWNRGNKGLFSRLMYCVGNSKHRFRLLSERFY